MKIAETVISLASAQVPYSMINRGIENDIVPYCLENKKSILAYSPLQRGLLTGKIKPGHHFNAGDTRDGDKFYTDESINRVNVLLQRLKPLAESKNATLSQLVIAWTINQPGITVALTGARNAEQAIQNAQAANVSLSHEEIMFVNTQLAQLD